jgi:hypothetical protein
LCAVFELPFTGPLGTNLSSASCLVRLLATCRSTLRVFTINQLSGVDAVEDLLDGLAACERLETLTLPWVVFSTATGRVPTSRFQRLTSLAVGCPRQEPLSSSSLWGLMATGAFSALTELRLQCGPGVWPQDASGVSGLMPAFAAVAGTLRTLNLTIPDTQGIAPDVLFQLGAAIGQLHALEHLTLQAVKDGRTLQALNRGMATGACPALRRVEVGYGLSAHPEALVLQPGLVGPGLQELHVFLGPECGADGLLLMCCGLVRLGYAGDCRVVWTPRGGDGGCAAKACVRQLLPRLRIR